MATRRRAPHDRPTRDDLATARAVHSAAGATDRDAAVGAATRHASRSDRDRTLRRRAGCPRARGLGRGARARGHRACLSEPVVVGELLEVDAAGPRRPRASARVAATARRAHRCGERATRAARLQFLSERAAAVVEVDTTYTLALAADARFRLSRQTARDADSLRAMTVARRDAGDASDLDVDLAAVAAGQQSNVASADSLTFMSALLTVQTLMGLSADTRDDRARGLAAAHAAGDRRDAAMRGDALATTPIVIGIPSALSVAARRRRRRRRRPPAPGVTPSIAAAEANVQAAELAVAARAPEHLRVAGAERRGRVRRSDRLRARPPPDGRRRAAAAALQPQPGPDRAKPRRSATVRARSSPASGWRRGSDWSKGFASATHSARRSCATSISSCVRSAWRRDRSRHTAEGASALPAVLEARRSAREVLGQYIDDLAALLTVNTELRALTQTVRRRHDPNRSHRVPRHARAVRRAALVAACKKKAPSRRRGGEGRRDGEDSGRERGAVHAHDLGDRIGRRAPGRYAALSAPSPTRIARVHVAAGQRVAAGAPLVEFEQAGFNAAASGAQSALRRRSATTIGRVRLAGEGIVPRKDVEQAAADLGGGALGGGDRATRAQLSVLRSPVSGVVTRMSAVLGAPADAGQVLVEVADPSAFDVVLIARADRGGAVRPGAPVGSRPERRSVASRSARGRSRRSVRRWTAPRARSRFASP